MAEKEAAPTTSEAVVVCLHPDFCRRGDSVVAYDIIARESDDEEHSTDVRITGCWASHDGARLKTVYHDSPGDAGVRSGCVQGYARPVADTSPTVLVNGRGCVRHDTEFEMNCDGPDGPHNTTGKMVYGQGKSSNRIGSDGAPLHHPAPPLEQVTEAEKALGFTDHAADFVSVVGNAVKDAVVGGVEGLAMIGQYGSDWMLGPYVDLFTGGRGHPALPTAQRARQFEQAVGSGLASLVHTAMHDPMALIPNLEALQAALASGEWGKAAGLIVVGLGELSPTQRLKLLSKLPDTELDDLVNQRVISADEAAKAKAARGDGDDGVHIRRRTPKELADGILKKATLRADDEVQFEKDLRRDLELIGETPEGRANLERLLDSEESLSFHRTSLEWGLDGNTGAVKVGYGVGDAQIPAASLAHELQHLSDMTAGRLDELLATPATLPGYPNLAEQLAVGAENAVAGSLNGRLRVDYLDSPLDW